MTRGVRCLGFRRNIRSRKLRPSSACRCRSCAAGTAKAFWSHGAPKADTGAIRAEIIDGLAGSSLGTINDKYEDELATARKTLREKRRIIQLLLESESRYRDLVETSHDLIWTTDAQGRFTYLNNGALDIFGLQPKDLLGRCFFDFEARPSHFSNRRFLSTLRRHGEVKNYITHLLAADGSDRWVGINARVSHDDNGQLCGIRGTARNVTEQHEAALQIEHLATHDSLTGLPNRVSLQRTLEHAMQQGDVGAMLFIDIDHFKYVNDNFGHRSGDQLIVGVSGVLKEAIKEFNGQVFRLGGDEYAIHLPESLRGQAMRVAEHLLDALRHYRFQSANQTARCPASPPRSASRSTRSTAATSPGCCRTPTSRCTRPRTAAATASCSTTRMRRACAAPTTACTGRTSCATCWTRTASCCTASRWCA